MHQSTSPLSRPLSRVPRLLVPLLALLLTVAMTQALPAQAATGASTAPAAGISTVGFDPSLRRAFRKRFRHRVMQVSRSKRGAPYRYGAAGPRAFDCSGYTSFVYRKAGRRIPRTSRQQARASHRVRARNRRRGDLVFFASRGRVYHVGIYAGRGRIWHSPRPGQRVHRERIWTRKHFYGRFR